MLNLRILLTVVIIFVAGCLSAIKAQNKYPDNCFRSPVDIPIFLSANFAELRSGHFHAGIDIKTEGVCGKKIYAIADGYVSRIRLSPWGYGKTLYVTHSNGYVSVYAHLQSFNEDIDKFAKKVMYKLETSEIDVYPPANQLMVKQNDLLGFSGNTGSSGGPHLHFEIRDEVTENAINPMLFGFEIKDNVKPTLKNLFVYPTDNKSFVNHKNEKIVRKLIDNNGKYSVSGDAIEVYGNIGFGLHGNDFLNGSKNICGLYSIEVKIDSALIYFLKLTEVSFAETRYIDSHIDFEEYVNNKRRIHKLWTDPNNRLSNYESIANRGIYSFTDNKKHTVSIIAKDVSGNMSTLMFKVYAVEQDSVIEKSGSEKLMLYNENNYFYDKDIAVHIPENSLYDSIWFMYSRWPSKFNSITDFHHIHQGTKPLHKPIKLTIKVDSISDEMKKKAFVAIEKKGRLKYLGGVFEKDSITVISKEFGRFAVFVDTVAPEISIVNMQDSEDISLSKKIEFTIKDDFSGINTYNGFIDDKWEIFDYEQKQSLLTCHINPKRIKKGKNHKLRLEITDMVGNINTYTSTFYY